MIDQSESVFCAYFWKVQRSTRQEVFSVFLTLQLFKTQIFKTIFFGLRKEITCMSQGFASVFLFPVTFVHANLCMHMLASTFQDSGNPFLVIRLPVLNSVTDLSQHTLLLPSLHSQWSRQVYIIHRKITGFLVVQELTCTHTLEYRLLGTWCLVLTLEMKSKDLE